jgi:hypothetical protein
MRERSGHIFAAVVVYVLALVPVTLIAVICLEHQPDLIVVPIEYLLPLWPASVAYRRGGAGGGAHP